MPPKKSNSDHAVAITKALLSLAPGGGALASLLGDYLPIHSEKSLERAMELLRERLEELDQRIDLEAVNKDDLAELFKSCYLSILRSHRDSKLEAATAILANLLLREGDQEKLSYTKLDHFARCVETLSSGAVEVLGEVMCAAGTEGSVDSDTKPYVMNFDALSCPSSNKWDRCAVRLSECSAHHFHVTWRVVDSANDVSRWSFV